MWYQALTKKEKDDKSFPEYEEKVIMSDAKKVILMKLFLLKQIYNPTDTMVNRYLMKFRDMLIDEYKTFSNVRNATEGLEMMPLIEKKVSEMFNEK
jgi:hypothetical protein